MEIPKITSAQNPLIKQFSTFNRRKTPDLILLDGPHLHTEYTKATQQKPQQTLVSERFMQSDEFSEFKNWPNLTQVPDSLMTKLSPSQNPSGILSLAPVPTLKSAAEPDLTLIFENIQDPGNVGTMLRTANAMDAGQVWLSGSCADIWGAKCLRAGMGAQFYVPCQKVSGLADWKMSSQAKLIGTSLKGGSLWKQPLPCPLALVFGNEGQGLSSEAEALCDQLVKIPMSQTAESLNVASSLAILAYEFRRQQHT